VQKARSQQVEHFVEMLLLVRVVQTRMGMPFPRRNLYVPTDPRRWPSMPKNLQHVKMVRNEENAAFLHE
jgi:hypothetical protein